MSKSAIETLADRCGVTATIAHEANAKDADGWEHNCWKVTLRYEGRQLTTHFRTGLGWSEDDITPGVVLGSLFSDWQMVEYMSYEEMLSDFGLFDTDQQRKNYRACEATGPRLQRLMGEKFDAAYAAAADS